MMMEQSEQLGATSASNLTQILEHFLERSYMRYSTLLQKGPLR
jgi:hypothetical protein